MNVFDKYLDNIAENAQLVDVINQLCIIHFYKTQNTLKDIFEIEFIKFIRWEIDIDNPTIITMYYEGKDLNTGNIEEMTKKFEWNNLLIKVDGYE